MSSVKLFSLKTIIGLIVTFLVSGGVAYAIVPASGGVLISPKIEEETGIKSTGFGQFANEPKTEACPLNGKLYSKSEKALWETRRPILAMIENDASVRPQSGLSSADIVYEAVAEDESCSSQICPYLFCKSCYRVQHPYLYARWRCQLRT
ncbi:MAG: hypothetical protein UV28_C0020G0021 [Candidatus Collierbacteria bacterium GW2011_GWE2_42_48]|nr:MAG: hypothetical protein UV28_C0020G0021 [Candidatus Collierbacteria bacterium GW2011_GWE2_42_48]